MNGLLFFSDKFYSLKLLSPSNISFGIPKMIRITTVLLSERQTIQIEF